MKKHTILLLLILLGAFVVRLYKIDNPVADWHSWRQADTSAVTRNFITQGFNPFFPRYDDLSNIQTGHNNPMGYRFVEFPLYNIISYLFIAILPGIFSVEVWQRLVSIIFSIGSAYFIYKLMCYFSSTRAALWGVLFFAILPFSIYYSRVILPEPLMIMLSLASLFVFTIWIEKEKIEWLILSAVCASMAILIKPFAIFFFAPIAFFMLTKRKLTRRTIFLSSAFAVVTLVPFGLWRLFISSYPEGIPAYEWLLNKDNIRGKGSFFYWLFAERLSKLILGYFGAFFTLTGIIGNSVKRGDWFFHTLGFSMMLYLFIVAGGNVQHDYYQVILIPIIVMYIGRGIDFLQSQTGKLFNTYATYGLITVVTLFTLGFSWYNIRTYYWINNPTIVAAGEKADELLPKNAKVIAPYSGDTAFLYQTGRQGWPQGFEIEDKIARGATHYVSVTPDDAEVEFVKSNHSVLYEGDGFIIISLQ